jgi:hemolysin D
MMKSASSVVPFPRSPSRRRDLERAFLPAALEIVETPPSPIGRAIAIVIVGAFCVAIAWATWGTVDIIATAEGKLVPSGRSKVIQPFDTAVIGAIHVRDGQRVRAGEVLIELDPTMDRAEEEHLHSDLVAAQLDVARLRAALADSDDPVADFHPPADAAPALVASERQLLVDQVNEERAKIATLDREAAEKAAESDTAQATIDKLAAEVPLQQERVAMRQTLVAKQLESKILYLQEAQDLVANQKELLVQRSHKNEARAAWLALVEQRAQAVSASPTISSRPTPRRRGWSRI